MIWYGGIQLSNLDHLIPTVAAISTASCRSTTCISVSPAMAARLDLLPILQRAARRLALQPPKTQFPLWPVGAVFVGSRQLSGDRRTARHDSPAGQRWRRLSIVAVCHRGRDRQPGQHKPLHAPARPLAQFPGCNGVYLLTLVDQRYFWWEKSTGDIEVDGITTTWAALLAVIQAAIGSPLNYDAIPAAYLKPSVDLNLEYELLPPLIDAAAYSIGKRLIRKLDGTLWLVSPATSRTAWNANVAAYRVRNDNGVYPYGNTHRRGNFRIR